MSSLESYRDMKRGIRGFQWLFQLFDRVSDWSLVTESQSEIFGNLVSSVDLDVSVALVIGVISVSHYGIEDW